MGAVSHFIASKFHYLSLTCTKQAPKAPPTCISLFILPAMSWLSQVISYHFSLLMTYFKTVRTSGYIDLFSE
jgi:hypothetical protein